jgi:prevent-host-death family protein
MSQVLAIFPILGQMKHATPKFRPHLDSLPQVSATELKNSIAHVFDQVAAQGAVAITRHEKPRAILLSVEEFEGLAEPEPEIDLDALTDEFRPMLDAMQSPEQKAAAKRLFEATPEELGEAALRGFQRRQANAS